MRILLCIMLLIVKLESFAQMGIGTNSPDSSAMLDVFSPNKGLLIPRVALTSADMPGPVLGAANGLLVYNTATAGTMPNQVKPGFYYWSSNRWNAVTNTGNNPGDMQYWNGSQWLPIPAGTANGQNLTWCNGKPQWGPCVTSFTIKPLNNQYEGFISSIYPNNWIAADQISISHWTFGGAPYSDRALIRFDYTGLPSGTVIDSAKLFLYADPTPLNGNLVDAHFGTSNAFSIQRITSTWLPTTNFTWNNPPTVTTANQVIVPQSTSSFQPAVVNVTEMVKDQIASGNNGFMLRLLTEVLYNSRQYVTSKNTDVARHPQLVIYYR